ncbi:MAG: dUTP diphosphatase [Oscillospiraceae bacterium]|jgi:dUTP pyrophosphatase|nr:dUTP diphosphatase [Oscillospiraceae bacterium]
MILKLKITRPGAKIPTYGTPGSAAADLYACLEAPVTLAPGETAVITLGFAAAVPEGYVGLVFARSGLATKSDLAPANKVGVVDSDYRGEWMVPMHNHGAVPRTIEHGLRIAQVAVVPVARVDFEETEELDGTSRGDGGFGSTGRS